MNQFEIKIYVIEFAFLFNELKGKKIIRPIKSNHVPIENNRLPTKILFSLKHINKMSFQVQKKFKKKTQKAKKI